MAQTTDTILLIKPSHFGFNPETAASNSFQQQGPLGVQVLALAEFNAFADGLSNEGINTIILDDVPDCNTPDAVFPNNWISMHHNGAVVLYPMEAISRRRERRNDIIEQLQVRSGFTVSETLDLTSFENQNQFLEGTGSIVFDHTHSIAFMAVSSRSHPQVLDKLCERLGYAPFVFTTMDYSGKPVYHTNVMMTVGNRFAIVCPTCMEGTGKHRNMMDHFEKTSRSVVEITNTQMAAFAGNMLEVKNGNGDPFLVMSQTALSSLNATQRKTLESFATLLPVAIPTIEKCGGGSVRCMMAEVFLPKSENKIPITIRTPKTTREFEEYYSLRWKVLRKPWGQPQGSEKDDLENHSEHFMAVDNQGKILATGRLHLLDPFTAQIRYMAVDEAFHSRGIGRTLVVAMEQSAKNRNCKRIFLQARENAVPFYKAMGYVVIEKTFLLYGSIQHYSMEKRF